MAPGIISDDHVESNGTHTYSKSPAREPLVLSDAIDKFEWDDVRNR